ncbi:Arm DNA-binding domain-containing protein [Xylella fastidiosa]|uniref:Arm DNA-binding domain-containing protein n=1 Tax=Xylella fastidiosa TaxID=2371 RepID=UPI003AFA7FD7
MWRFRYRLAGRYEKLTLGKYPALSLRNARLKRDEAASLVAMGISPARQKQLAKVTAAHATTVRDFAERFFREIQSRDRKDSTMPRRKPSAAHHLRRKEKHSRTLIQNT